MSHTRKNRTGLVSSVAICFALLLCLSCNKKEVHYFAQGNGPDLVFEIAPNDSALCYISFQSVPYKLNELNKEEVTLNGNIDVSWESKQLLDDIILKLKVNDKQVLLKDTFSLTISTLIDKKEKFFYYNDLLKKVPEFVSIIKQSYNDVDSVFKVRAAQQFSVTNINVVKPLNIDASAIVGSNFVSNKTNHIVEEREYINPADFPGVK